MTSDFERAAEEFLQQIGREHYQNGAGLKENLDIIPIFDRYGWIFERSTVEEALKREDKEGRYIAAFVADGFLDADVKELSEKITNQMTQAKIEWQGEQVPYRRATLVLANEPDPGKRHDLEDRILTVTDSQNTDRVERMQHMHILAKDLGFTNYLVMFDQLKGIRLDWLLGEMKQLLDTTEAIYESELQHYLGEIGVAPDEATPADLVYLFRAPQFDGLFPQEKLVPSLKATFIGMGIDLDAQKNIHLDIESRPTKSPRAFCAPVQVPDEVYLVISPRGGQDDYKAILHESGHAEHLGSVSPDLPFAFKRLGDGSISESYAFLFDNLLKNRNWFIEILEQRHVDDYLRLARFHKLWIIRRYAAKLQYEQLLHTAEDIPSMRNKYAEILGKALKLNVSPANFLADIDDGLYSANYLRAWIFEVMLRKHMEDSFGVLWFRTKKAGDMLVGMWKQGQEFSVDELAHQINYEMLDTQPLMQELAR
ncbi:MAG TPA: hypothetical protein PLZ21_07695 [Armatimonadota bacterium]|nr:hypothetical protein [Armatimonadota bacterium]HOP80428.1 hypothetical protein [Armatimonadota bacterium]